LGAGTAFTVSLPTGAAHLPAERIHGPRGAVSTGIGATPFVEEALRWLPAESGAAEAPPAAAWDDAERGTAPARAMFAPARRILVVDDNADMREYLLHLLAPHWEVDLAVRPT